MEVNIKLSESTQPQTSTSSRWCQEFGQENLFGAFPPRGAKTNYLGHNGNAGTAMQEKGTVAQFGTGCQLKSKQSNKVNQYDLSL